jgi:uncharacterized membrane protein YbhN (UPF0104 family)
MGLALITPARLGELVRIAYLRDKQKLKIAGLVLIDKGFDVLVLCALSIVGAFALFGFWAGLGLAIVTVVGVAAVYRPVAWSRSLNAISSRTPLALHLNRTWSSLQSLTPWTTSLYLALTLLSFAIVLLQFGIVLLSWHAWSPSIVFLTFPMVVLTNVLPLTIGGLGIREGAAAVLLGHYGVSPADAALAAFLMFAMNTALPGIVGALLLPALPAGEQSRVVQSLDRP